MDTKGHEGQGLLHGDLVYSIVGCAIEVLRGIGHGLSPVVMVGKGEVGDALLRETTEALEAHELIKVKILESCLLDLLEVLIEVPNCHQRGTAPSRGPLDCHDRAVAQG